MNLEFLKEKADYIRREVIRVAVSNQAGHIAPSLSCIEILTALYYECMNYDFKNPYWEDRDRLIFSKSHGGYGLYAILVDKGLIPKEEWENFNKQGSKLSGCIERNLEFGLEAGCGSLGHGLPMAVGLSLGAKLKNKDYRVFCLMGDGEFQEGSNWEAVQFAVKYNLNNLTIIIDKNRLQAMDFITSILDRTERDLLNRLKGFGLRVRVVRGHNLKDLVRAINKAKFSKRRPEVILAQTIKGYGLKCMENVPKFHYRVPTQEELSESNSYE